MGLPPRLSGLTEPQMPIDSPRKPEMKPRVAVALIVMGTVLILAPIAADYLFQRNFVAALAKEQTVSATVTTRLSVWYSAFCWLAGSLMVFVSTIASVSYARPFHYKEPDDGDDVGEDEDKEK